MAAALLVAAAGPAEAHTVGGAAASNYQTNLTSVSPEIDGITVTVVERGNRLELRNETDEDVIVLGYQNEPYLRVGPDGVFENLRSPATYLNRDRQATTVAPPDADAEAEPDWHQISDGQVARWHDHRIHFMGNQDPVQVREAPGERHVVNPEWIVPLRHGDTEIEVTGNLEWVPGPAPWPWWIVAAAALGITVVLGRQVKRVYPFLAVGLALLVLIDIVHVIGIALATAGDTGSRLGQVVTSGWSSIASWVIGGVGVWLLARNRSSGLYFAFTAAALIAAIGGIGDLAVLSRSQVVFAWTPGLARALVALSLGIGIGLAIVAGVETTRIPRKPAPRRPPPEPIPEADADAPA
jgi:hypothetical protein